MSDNLSYLESLKLTYTIGLSNNLVWQDYTQFPSGYKETIEIILGTDIPFGLGTHTQTIDTTQPGNLFVERNYEWVLGFYSDDDLEFDIYENHVFQNHYCVKKFMFLPLVKHDEYYMHCSKNCPHGNNALEIRNLTTTQKEIKLISLGVALNHDEFNETLASGIQEVIISTFPELNH